MAGIYRVSRFRSLSLARARARSPSSPRRRFVDIRFPSSSFPFFFPSRIARPRRARPTMPGAAGRTGGGEGVGGGFSQLLLTLTDIGQIGL